jgi:catechol 2,3-dioxygenase-like lactoylglutathione lyase family enzyme
MPAIQGYHHMSLTVSDLEASAAWYQKLFGLERVLTEEHAGGYAYVFVDPGSQTYFGLHRHDANGAERFHESRTGLDHLCFAVADRAELVAWEQRMTELDVTHSPIVDTPYGSVLAFRDPDNIQLELASPPAT